jgi:murein L,D-transpeptidase YafK
MTLLLASLAHAADGCPASADGLPVSPYLDRSDPRLDGPNLVVVLKEARRAAVYGGGALRGCWTVALGAGADPGPKQVRGDRKTPEGWYRTSPRPQSAFYHALHVSYPGPEDAARGLRDGLVTREQHDAIVAAARRDELPPMNTRLGGLILLHGGGGTTDWTLGCVGLDDADIDALRALLPADLRADVLILP